METAPTPVELATRITQRTFKPDRDGIVFGIPLGLNVGLWTAGFIQWIVGVPRHIVSPWDLLGIVAGIGFGFMVYWSARPDRGARQRRIDELAADIAFLDSIEDGAVVRQLLVEGIEVFDRDKGGYRPDGDLQTGMVVMHAVQSLAVDLSAEQLHSIIHLCVEAESWQVLYALRSDIGRMPEDMTPEAREAGINRAVNAIITYRWTGYPETGNIDKLLTTDAAVYAVR